MMLTIKNFLTTSLLIASFTVSLSSVQAMDASEENGNLKHPHKLTKEEYYELSPKGKLAEGAFTIGTLEAFRKQTKTGHWSKLKGKRLKCMDTRTCSGGPSPNTFRILLHGIEQGGSLYFGYIENSTPYGWSISLDDRNEYEFEYESDSSQ